MLPVRKVKAVILVHPVLEVQLVAKDDKVKQEFLDRGVRLECREHKVLKVRLEIQDDQAKLEQKETPVWLVSREA